MSEPRNPLDKERFLEGNRQKWAALGMASIGVVLVCHLVWKIDPKPYLESITEIITVGLVGWSVDSAWKIHRYPRGDSRDYTGPTPIPKYD